MKPSPVYVERPMLMSAPMVRAILSGGKTQTRRAVKWRGLEPGLNLQFSGLSVERSGSNWVLSSPTRTSHEYRSVPMPCPYGQPGQHLWVREAWARTKVAQDASGSDWLVYREGDNRTDYGGPWKPSIHMFRKDSRITLEIISVRVERLQDISEADAQAEGARECDPVSGREVLLAGSSQRGSFVLHYRDIWEKINGAGSWDANPWVWVVEFRRLNQGEQP